MSDDAHRYCGGYYEAHTCGEIDALTWRAEKAEAQVQRVRELPAIQFAYPDGHVRDMVELAGILAALDGAK